MVMVFVTTVIVIVSIMSVALLLLDVHLGAEASSLSLIIFLVLDIIDLEKPGRLHHVLHLDHPLLLRLGVLPGGDGAEVAGAAAEEAGHGAGGGAEAGYEHAAQVTPDSQLRQ